MDNNILIKRIKNALKSESPIDNVREVITQYEDIERLVKWRDEIITSGRYHGAMIEEINDINDKICSSGFSQETPNEYFDKKIKEFFENI